jgi:hypothetical protein
MTICETVIKDLEAGIVKLDGIVKTGGSESMRAAALKMSYESAIYYIKQYYEDPDFTYYVSRNRIEDKGNEVDNVSDKTDTVLIGTTKGGQVKWTARKQADGRYLIEFGRQGGHTEVYGNYSTIAGARKALKRVFEFDGGKFENQ